MNLKLLADPFPASDIEWRVGRAGQNAKGCWATVLAYLTNRAIMERLDDVCGPGKWRNEYRYEAGGAVLCGLSIKVDDDGYEEWVTKWDGAENTDIEKVKGGLSGAMKRAAVQWGIGRYLYDLEEGFANVGPNGKHYQPAKKENNGKPGYPAFNWDPPKLPAWALPSGARNGAGVKSATETSGELGRVDPPKQEARQQAAPASPASEAKADEDKKWKGKTLGERSDDELREIMEAVKSNGLLVELIDSCRRILTKRHPDAKLNKAIADEHAQQSELKIPA